MAHAFFSSPELLILTASQVSLKGQSVSTEKSNTIFQGI